ncbi:glycosyltransferase [Mesorhizobium sp. CA14]|uniref:glycosyltransferase n=1 Tax=Mesorhizobium sp. CA14 TaxID=2876642 RepID=UPI001CCB110B|nr:glycosyltransferase [Mesorhizobium sp. CA14]
MNEPSKPSRARLFTAFGTVIYVDPSTSELRHGAVEYSPANTFVEQGTESAGIYRQVRLIYDTNNSHEPIHCFPDACLSASRLQGRDHSDSPATFDLIPLERGLVTLRSGGLFMSAIPDGHMRLRATLCSTWELFIASENWCSENAGSDLANIWRRSHSFDKKRIEDYIIHPIIRMNSARQPQAKKILIYGYTKWSHGRVYYDLCRHLHDRGYIVDLLDWQVDHAEYAQRVISYYDFVVSALDGVSRLVDEYEVPFEKIIAISHHEFDIRMLIEQKGIHVFERFANYGVVGQSVYCASIMRGVPRLPMVASLGINYDEFYAEPPRRLTTVGYASSMSVKTFGIEWKRGHLAEAAAGEAGLAFKVAGSTANQISFHDMPEFYRSVDAVLSTSINESGPLSVLEGAAAGRLVIGTPVGHFPLRAYQGGGIIAPIEPEKFKAFTSSTLRYYKENAGEFVTKCAAIQEAARKFDWAYTIEDWIGLIEAAAPTNSTAQPIKIHAGIRSTNPRKGIICDIKWLESYLANEHHYEIKLLSEIYGFDIIDSKAIDFSDETTLNDLNSYSILIVAYQGRVSIPLNKISAYKLFRVDDLVSYDKEYDDLIGHLISHADMIISPYAYEFSNHFKHDSVVWIPYSSALEGCKDHERVTYNEDPIKKVLLTGSVAWDRPLRQYVAGLDDARIATLEHPGYHKRYDDYSQDTVRTAYYEKLSEFLCCFCDGHTYRYVHLKNFEIASVGSLLLTDRLIEKEMNELGFIDYETCVFTAKDDFLEKVEWIVDERNRPAVDKIRKAGMQLVRDRHMTRHRAQQINDLVASCLAERG